MSTLYLHYSEVQWDSGRWPNFRPEEKNIHCPCCGQFVLCAESFDKLQEMRSIIKKPFTINSGHRCAIHNARVGGAPMSRHKILAFDIALHGHDPKKLLRAALRVGFVGIGFYYTFLHVDLRPATARWYANTSARVLWSPIVASL